MRMSILAALLAVGLVAPGLAHADDIVIDQYFSAAPNFFGSPSWAGYLNNAMTSLANTPGTGIGNPSADPTAYAVLGSTYAAGDVIVSNYPLWMGQPNPTGAFSNELGNRLHAGVVITDLNGTFDLSDVSFTFSSLDPSNSLAYSDNLAGTNFAAGTRLGYDSHGNLVCDPANPCTDTTQISKLVYVGVGNAFDASGDLTNLTSTIAFIDAYAPDISNTYCVKDSCETTTLRFAGIPEPASAMLLGAGLQIAIPLSGWRRRLGRRVDRTAR